MTDQQVNFIVKPELYMEDINARIKQEICYETLEKLTDANLMYEYKDCKSVKNEIKKLSDILEKYINEETKQRLPALGSIIKSSVYFLTRFKHNSTTTSFV